MKAVIAVPGIVEPPTAEPLNAGFAATPGWASTFAKADVVVPAANARKANPPVARVA